MAPCNNLRPRNQQGTVAVGARKKRPVQDDSENETENVPIKPAKKRAKRTTTTKKRFVPSGQFSFMDLPAELRDMVYHELWQDTELVIKHQVGGFSTSLKVAYNGAPEAIEDKPARVLKDSLGYPMYVDRKKLANELLPDWLRVNKTIMEEGLAQFRRGSSWFWGPSESRRGRGIGIGHYSGGWRDNDKTHVTPGIAAPLLLPIQTDEMKILVHAKDRVDRPGFPLQTRYIDLAHSSKGKELGMLRHVLQNSIGLKSLKIFVSMNSELDYYYPTGYHGDLVISFLELQQSLGLRLDELEFNIRSVFSNINRLPEGVRNVFTEAVHNVARALVDKQVAEVQPELTDRAEFQDVWELDWRDDPDLPCILTYKFTKPRASVN